MSFELASMDSVDVSDDDSVSLDDPVLNFEDDKHQGLCLTKLNTLRKGGDFCDVTFEIGGKSISAHRNVLATCSVPLYELFKQEKTNGPQRFKLETIDSKAFAVLVDYAYTSR